MYFAPTGRPFSLWVTIFQGTILNIKEGVDPATQSNRIFRNESSNLRVIPAGAIEEQARQRIAFTASVVVTRVDAAGAVAIAVIADLL